ncbi:AEC family transporter [Methylomonas sp. MED-D]|uniref:AEC family transporter n=1 Tax=unclassified Methylomonas TaxID=2608980 RepID=UPI00247840DF|nr:MULTISPECIES: AEC family transporter [unclassified Methylomonas]MDT4331324.1 AEC family transporter [Methylomonas sp. MV1]WGS84538.1 AEC family transporter [Methylomonas sp. UP202]
MTTTLIQMTVLMLCGAAWRVLCPNKLAADQTRLVLTSVVYYFLLPAMVLEVLWKADIGWQSLKFSLLGCSSILLAVVVSGLIAKLLRFQRPQTGAMILAAAFPNTTYLGLPVLEQAYGGWSRSVVIQMDLFAAAPMVFTVGILLARHYGAAEKDQPKSRLGFFNAPPFWAALLAVVLNLNHLPAPLWLAGLLTMLSAAVAPLMIFSLGLALSWRAVRWRNLPYIPPVVLIKLMWFPWAGIYIADVLQLENPFRAAAILDIAMPSMVLGVVLCDRYQLDSSLYATAVTVTTGLSLFSLPFWFEVL